MAKEEKQNKWIFELVILLAMGLSIVNLYYSADILSRYLDAKSSHLSWLEQDKILEDLAGYITNARRPGTDIYKTRRLTDEKRKFLKAELALYENADKFKVMLVKEFKKDSKVFIEYMRIYEKFIKANSVGKNIFIDLLNGDEKGAYESKLLMDSLYGASMNELIKFKDVFRAQVHDKAMKDHRKAIDLMGTISYLMLFSIVILGAIYFSHKKEIEKISNPSLIKENDKEAISQ